MPRDIPVGNGSLLVAFDKDALLREFYFPHVGQERHAGARPFRLGVWAEGGFSWVPQGWTVSRDYEDGTLATRVSLEHAGLGLRLELCDLVDFHENVFLRRLTVRDLARRRREVRLFLHQDFDIYGSEIGDTAAFQPEAGALLHYKGERYFLVNAQGPGGSGFDQYATGNKDGRTGHGTWMDAEDGVLSGNPIAQGAVDSVAGLHLSLEPGGERTIHYWICAGRSWKEVSRLDGLVRERSPEALIKRTKDYWRCWVDKEAIDFGGLPPRVVRLYKRSLLIARTQIDNGGAVIAGNDSDVVQFNRDTYSYMWPRDGALTAYALDLAGYPEVTCRFFNLCGRIVDRRGYFLHKYNPCGSLASSWHPWLKDGKPQLPIQEDETALVLWALWKHYQAYRDIEFIKPLYKPLIKNAADFMLLYRDERTRLPSPSYDLWEERRGVLTFTAACVHGGLTAAARFAEAFGETVPAAEYRKGAQEIRQGMDRHLYLEGEKRFARMVNFSPEGAKDVDAALDASLYGLFAFGAYGPGEERVRSTMAAVEGKLWCRTSVGGLARYEGDRYHRISEDVPGNPWFVTTLWLAQYRIARAKTRAELEEALPILEWVAARALPSGVLAEQVDPHTDEPLSVSPLTWSHATYVAAVREYLDKLAELEGGPAGRPLKASGRLRPGSPRRNPS